MLNTFCWLGTMLAYVKYSWRRRKSPKGLLLYGLRWLFFALGLLSKPMVVTLPFVLLLVDFWPLRRVTGFTECRAESELPRVPAARHVAALGPGKSCRSFLAAGFQRRHFSRAATRGGSRRGDQRKLTRRNARRQCRSLP